MVASREFGPLEIVVDEHTIRISEGLTAHVLPRSSIRTVVLTNVGALWAQLAFVGEGTVLLKVRVVAVMAEEAHRWIMETLGMPVPPADQQQHFTPAPIPSIQPKPWTLPVWVLALFGFGATFAATQAPSGERIAVLLANAGAAVFLVGILGLIRPVPVLRMHTRATAGMWIAAGIGLMVWGALSGS